MPSPTLLTSAAVLLFLALTTASTIPVQPIDPSLNTTTHLNLPRDLLHTAPPGTPHASGWGTGPPGFVYYCSSPGWHGRCRFEHPHKSVCNTILDWETNYYLNISSFKPAPRTCCTIFDRPDCPDNGGKKQLVKFPGFGDLRRNGWDDKIRSYRCGFPFPFPDPMDQGETQTSDMGSQSPE
ncbi:hypothetical protein K402DRAFT_467641 [Aulographum hederae CBS 113979]|uniref:Uncharacterized protein n=1 Tax=Aulographum hederae CBS 113979 TaxID=1176131 RepID=A0A6G1GK24_9PEZI|nr:hypothetical protein K402DRAFT_467641 [Aulographum hederae CBS 113979]